MLDTNNIDNIIDFLTEWFEKNGSIEVTDTEKLSHFMFELGAEINNFSVVPENGGTELILYAGEMLMLSCGNLLKVFQVKGRGITTYQRHQ